MSRAIRGSIRGDQNIRPPPGNAGIDGLTNSRLELAQITRQIEDNLALLAVHCVQFHTHFHPTAIGFSTAVTSHATHRLYCSCHSGRSREILSCSIVASTPSSPSVSRGIPVKLASGLRGAIPRLR